MEWSKGKRVNQWGFSLKGLQQHMQMWLVLFWVWIMHFISSSMSTFVSSAFRHGHNLFPTVLWDNACGGKQVFLQVRAKRNTAQKTLVTCGVGLVANHRLAVILLCLIHSGEAFNPGPRDSTPPVWTLGTFNPSGLNGKQQILAEHLAFGDVWAVTETHLSSRAAHSFRAGLKSNQNPFKYCVCGHPAPQRPQSEHVGAWTGVATLSRFPTRPVPIVWKQDSYQTSRVQVTATLCHDLWITGGIVYGEPTGVAHPFAKEHTESLLQEVIDAVTSVKGLRFVAGDWNFQLGQLEAFQYLHQHGFQDLQTIAEELWGWVPQPTCKGVTRKDFFFVSPELRDLLTDVRIEHDVWSDHSVLAGVFRGGPRQVARYSWKMPTQFPWPQHFGASSFSPQVDLEATDPSTAYADLWQQVETYALSMQAQHVPEDQESTPQEQPSTFVPKHAFGRGSTMQTIVKYGSNRIGTLKKGRPGDVVPLFHGQSVQHAHWFRQLRRLQAYCRHRKAHPVDDVQAHGVQLWRSILCAKGFEGGFSRWWTSHATVLLSGAPSTIPLVAPEFPCAELVYQSFAMEVRKLENRLNHARKAHAIKRREDMAMLVFQDVKKVPPDRVDLLLSKQQASVVDICSENLCVTLSKAIPLDWTQPCVIDGRSFEIIHAEQEWVYLDSIEGITANSTLTQHRFVGKIEDMFQEFEAEWTKRWNRHSHVESEQWKQIIDFARVTLPWSQIHMSDITPHDLRQEISKKKLRSATVLDGVSLTDLKSMPDPVLQSFCNVFHRAETTGEWPQQLLEGKVASLAKTDSPSRVQEFRPITIFSQLFRLWGSLRAKQILKALDRSCPAWLLGNRPGCHAMQMWMHIQWMVETAHTTGCHLAGVSADIQKAFNHLPREVVMATGLCVGIPVRVLTGWAGALQSITRRFQIRDSLGPAIKSVTGCPEGCSMSCVGMLLVNMLFHHWVSSQCPASIPLSYVDDWQVLTTKVAETIDIMQSVEQFTSKVDLLLDRQKTYAWSTDPKCRHSFKQHQVHSRNQARSLGAQMQYTKAHRAKVIHDRILDVQQLWPKLRSSLSPYFLKVRVLSRAAWPRGLHAISATCLGNTAFKTLRAGAMKGLDANGSGCSSWIHLGLIESPEADPQFWALRETLRCVRLCQNEAQVEMLLDLAVQQVPGIPRGGPTSALINRMNFVGWTVHSGALVSDRFGTFSLFATSFQEVMFRAAESWKQVVADKMAGRKCFEGLHQADPASTRRFLATLPVQDQALYRKVLNGAAFTNDILYHFSESGSTSCKFCGAPDSRTHRFWFCPAFQGERKDLPLGFIEALDQLPSCLTQAGWAIQSHTQEQWWQYLLTVQHGPPRPMQPEWPDEQGWVDVFTDGSCFLPTRENVRFASWSACRASPNVEMAASEVIAAGALPGLIQSAFRAELYAVFQSISWAVQSGCKLRLWTDCQGVVTKLQKMIGGQWKPQANARHADLWEQIFELLVQLGPGACIITKVAAHQSVSSANTPIESWAYLHNSLADRAACLANLCRPETFWSFHQEHLTAVDNIQILNDRVHRLILAVSKRAIVRDIIDQSDGSMVREATETTPPTANGPSADRWVVPLLRTQVPLSVSQRFGHRLTALAAAWWQEGIEKSQQAQVQPCWVSWYQLFIDYQLRTGDHGPYYDGGWQDPAIRVMLKARPFRFRKRCAWFVQLVKFLHKCNELQIQQKVTRPESVAFSLHASSIWCVWPVERLQEVERWVLSRLPRAATRDGKSLDQLPVAKQLDEQSTLRVIQGPLSH